MRAPNTGETPGVDTPATARQRWYLELLDCPDFDAPGLTKAQASALIDRYKDERQSYAWGVWGDLTG